MKEFGDYLIEEKEQLKRKLDAVEVLLEDYEVEANEPEPRKPKMAGVKKKGGGCSKCGKRGHNAKTCGRTIELAGERTLREKGERKCKACGKPGHRSDSPLCPKRGGRGELAKVKLGDDGPLAEDDDDKEPERKEPEITREQVQELKEQGLTSLQVAWKLKCRLGTVNTFW